MTELVYLDEGKAAYKPTLNLQKKLVEQVKITDQRAYLLLVEHTPPVITLGVGAKPENILASKQQLAQAGIEVHRVSRGGDVTYHGPGQLVGYPILRLNKDNGGVHTYIRNLEEVLIRLLGRFGLDGHRIDGLSGVWVGDEKIAAIGVAVRKWITYHGFALNVCPDLSHFEMIVPCGIEDKRVTSMERLLGRPISVEEVKPALIECMVDVFGFNLSRACESELIHEN